MSTGMLLVLAIVGGTAVTLQGNFMGIMDQNLGTKESLFVTYGSGGILVVLMMLAARGGHLNLWHRVPWYVFTAGALGVLVVGTIGYTVPRLGLAKAFTVMVAAQLVSAVILDHFGLFGATLRLLDVQRLAGLVMMILSVWLILK